MKSTSYHLSLIMLLAMNFAPAFAQTQTGRQLDIIAAPTGTETVPSQGGAVFDVRPVVGIFWDERCASVEYTFNTNQGANPGTETEITSAELTAIVQRGLDRWNDNPSSYIEMNVTRQTDLGNRPRIGGDFINEVTFITDPSFTALASSPSTSLTSDATFVAGQDIDGDGDLDVFDPVAEGLNRCTDIDNDGDIEFPAGDYRAGTILDNDVQFSSFVTWETVPTGDGGADVDAVSTHEFGHSHGLSHTSINQISATDGTTSTMFPFISTSNPTAELGTRTPHVDDLAASALIYQEGVGVTELSQLQSGDVAFDEAYSLVTGRVSNVDDDNIVGAAVGLRNDSTGRLEAVTFSGQSVAFEDDTGLFAFAESARSGHFTVAVPTGQVYVAEIEALDGSPVAASRVSTNANIGEIIGGATFPEERHDSREKAFELRPDRARQFFAGLGTTPDIDFITNEELVQRNAGTSNLGLSGNIIGATSLRYAEKLDRTEVLARLAQGDVPFGAGVNTSLPGEAAATFSFSQGGLGLGLIDNEGNADIRNIIGERRDILAEDGDLTRVPFRNIQNLRFLIKRVFDRRPEAELFILLDIDNVQTGPNSGLPLGFIQNDDTLSGTSFLSIDNGPLQPVDFTWGIELRYANDGREVPPELRSGGGNGRD